MTFEIECPQCGLHITADHADAGMEGVCPGCNAGIVVPDPSFEDATSGSEMNGETHAFTEEPPPIPASAVSGHGAATHAFPHEAVAHGAPTVPLGTLKSILPLVLLIALLGWVPLLAMHGGRLVQASSGATFILTGLCASFAAAALSYRWLRPRGISGLAALLVFLSTAVAGVSLLLAFQWCAEFTLKHGPVYAGKATVWIWIIQFAGKCYAWSGSADFFKQTVGCVFGIGVYEELTKILPLAVVLFTGYGKPLAGRINYRAFVALGFLSGLAFGISEALVVYSPWAQTLQIDDSGMGVLGTPITSGLNRWFSCVPMHALWGAADAAVLWLLSTRLLSAKSPLAMFGILILATMAMAVVHGLYDAACFRGSYAGIALGIGSVFLVQWIVAHSAASSDPVPANSSGCERPLEMFFRLPYAIALILAIGLAGFGALYSVSIQSVNLSGSHSPSDDQESVAAGNSHNIHNSTPTVQAFPQSFIKAIEECHQAYRQTAGAEYPRMLRAMRTPGGNADAISIALGNLMQRHYEEQILSSLTALKSAEEQLQKQTDTHNSLRERLSRYGAIIGRNAQMFSTTEPMSLLQLWFNDYPDEQTLYTELIQGVTPHRKESVLISGSNTDTSRSSDKRNTDSITNGGKNAEGARSDTEGSWATYPIIGEGVDAALKRYEMTRASLEPCKVGKMRGMTSFFKAMLYRPGSKIEIAGIEVFILDEKVVGFWYGAGSAEMNAEYAQLVLNDAKAVYSHLKEITVKGESLADKDGNPIAFTAWNLDMGMLVCLEAVSGKFYETFELAGFKNAKKKLSGGVPALVGSPTPTFDKRNTESSAPGGKPPEFKAGDKVRITRAATLTFNGKTYRDAAIGDRFNVLAYRPAEKRVYLGLRDSEGKDFAVAVEEDAVEFVRAAVNRAPTAAKAIGNTSATDQRAMAAKVAAEVARLRKNADVIDHPNRLFPNDTSNEERAAQLRAQADALEQQTGLPTGRAR